MSRPAVGAAHLRRRAQRAQPALEAAIRASLERSRTEAASSTPVDTGEARRSWRVVRGRAGWVLVNDRRRVRFAAGGQIYQSAIRLVRARFRADRRSIARQLKGAR